MSEYDYSGLYNNGGPQNNNGQPAGTQPEQPQAEQSSYPNVGSSGVNTANTAQTDYSNYSSQQNSSYNPQGPAAGNGGNGGNGNNGGYNGYSYSSNPQPPQNEPKKSHGGKKVLLRVAACIGVVALGFGGGLAGTVVASRTGFCIPGQHQRHQPVDSGCCRAGTAQRCGHHHRADGQHQHLVWRQLCAERCRLRRDHLAGWLHCDLCPCGFRRK